MNVEISLSLEQKQKLSSMQIQSLQLLAMDNFELCQMMETEYLENPLLEYEGGGVSATIENGVVDYERKRQELPTQDEGVLKRIITGQLEMKKYSAKEWAVIDFLIDNLDDHGFFTSSIEEIAAIRQVSEQMIRRLLNDLKKVEPYGIFAESLQECLLLQLNAKGDTDPLKKVLIENYLEELARGEISVISRNLSVPTVQIRKVLEEIAKLNPRPLNGINVTKTDYIIPDIIMQLGEEKQRFRAVLNDDWSADYHISDYYHHMMKNTNDQELRSYFEKKYYRAKALIEGIEQRRETILSIANYMGNVQYEFFLRKSKKVPITMTEVAEELKIAVSTVSRAVKGKYIQYPSGCVFFKDLFETPINKSGEERSKTRDDIKEELKILIEKEDKRKPYSDIELAEKLREKDIIISRRTVAKYRDSMGIKGCFDRRKF